MLDRYISYWLYLLKFSSLYYQSFHEDLRTDARKSNVLLLFILFLVIYLPERFYCKHDFVLEVFLTFFVVLDQDFAAASDLHTIAFKLSF